MSDLESMEKRHFERFAFREPVQFKYKDPSIYGGTIAADLSEGGVKVIMNEFVPIHTEMMLQLSISTNRVIDCMAEVKWVEKLPYADRYQVGFEFEATDEIASIRKVIQKSHP